ncbi:MAG: SH3 domain-containing protein [Saprospiraceae bacterium]
MKKTLIFLLAAGLFGACKQDNKIASPASDAKSDVAAPASKPSEAHTLKVGGVLYVHAPSGLVLRKTPSKDGEKIMNLPMNGEPLTVLELPDPANRYVAERMGSFEVSGGWVKVRTNDGKEGYLFEGYLSRYLPQIEEPEADIDSYVEAFYARISRPKGERKPLPQKPGLVEGYRQEFEDGAVFQFEYYEGGVTHHFYLPADKFTVQEAFVLFRPLWFWSAKTKGEYDAATKRLTITDIEGYQHMSIEPKDGQLLLEFSSAD